jgi:hypothetical protein
MYASFLDEASQLLQDEKLHEISKFTTEVGDLWREFAMKAVLFCKKRKNISLEEVSESLRVCAQHETLLREKLLAWSK